MEYLGMLPAATVEESIRLAMLQIARKLNSTVFLAQLQLLRQQERDRRELDK